LLPLALAYNVPGFCLLKTVYGHRFLRNTRFDVLYLAFYEIIKSKYVKPPF
jgi:hypothetical protein